MMRVGDGAHSPFEKSIETAVTALQTKDYPTAQDYIKYAMLENPHAPEVHNLLGALAELTGDLDLAGRHYRAAYALDPTYRPASRNLARITSFYYKVESTNPDFGDQPEEAEESLPYILEYDDKNIGRLRKRSK